MKKSILLFGLISGVVILNLLLTTSGCSNETIDTMEELSSITNKNSILPTVITQQDQTHADIFSWLSFIAINWPANTQDCQADTSNGMSILSGQGPTVWETFLSTDQVFVTPPAQPANWCGFMLKGSASFEFLPPTVKDLAQKTGIFRVIHRSSKFPHALGQASGQPLVDQNQRFVRYEVRINMDEYNYIKAKNLWNAAGQQAFTQDSIINFPDTASQYGPSSAMEIKAAWKVMGKGDQWSKFYTIKAIIYNDDQLDSVPAADTATLGLVGLHIARKVRGQDNWVWSTFEQVDNLKTSFYNPSSTTVPNQPPDTPYVEYNKDGTLKNKPTQVTRVNKVQDTVVGRINQRFQTLLKGSVWANYELISTQWLQFERMTPNYLANSVQETYLQYPHPDTFGYFKLHSGLDVFYYEDPRYSPFAKDSSSSSCMGCHYTASSVGSNKPKTADFSFILGEAH